MIQSIQEVLTIETILSTAKPDMNRDIKIDDILTLVWGIPFIVVMFGGAIVGVADRLFRRR